MRTKLGVLTVSFVFLFAMMLAGCGDQDKPKQAPKATEIETKAPEVETKAPEAETKAPEAKPQAIKVENIAPKTAAEPQDALAPEKK